MKGKTGPSRHTRKYKKSDKPTWSDTVKFQKTDKPKIEVASRGKWQLQVKCP